MHTTGPDPSEGAYLLAAADTRHAPPIEDVALLDDGATLRVEYHLPAESVPGAVRDSLLVAYLAQVGTDFHAPDRIQFVEQLEGGGQERGPDHDQDRGPVTWQVERRWAEAYDAGRHCFEEVRARTLETMDSSRSRPGGSS